MMYAVIMAGGSGTRFWPQSRKNKPKQLLSICGRKTMIRATVERILPEISFDRIMVVTGEAHAAELKNQVPELAGEMIVAEPSGRNTAPCVALAAYKLQKIDPEGVMVVLPADHLILNREEFLRNVITGADAARKGNYLLTFGVVPDRPETGYGYIKLGPQEFSLDSKEVFRVDAFVEKPNPTLAREYVASGEYVWNSGMFVWKIADIVRAVETYLPSLGNAMRTIVHALNTPDEAAAVKRAYDELDSISVDYGIMEKADNVLCVPMDVGWNDVGSWASLGDVWGQDDLDNASKGAVVGIDTKNCIVSSPHKLAALIGVEDLIVVDTPDALMICRKDKAQDVGKLREMLKLKGYNHLL
jgi:mannose-1-phosphate guanylyltransferase